MFFYFLSKSVASSVLWKMNNNRLKEEILVRFLNNQSSKEEEKQVMEWLNDPDSEKEIVRVLHRRWRRGEVKELSEEKKLVLLDKIHAKTLGEEKKQKKSLVSIPAWRWGRSVAAFLLFAFSLYFLFEEIMSDKNKEVVTEKRIDIIEKEVEAGKKLRLTLPDQTKVTINSLSKVSFAFDYGIRDREILLEGEAFFEITPDKDRPFKVRTGTVVTTALGTAFNAYSRGDAVEIALTEGAVVVSDETKEVKLSPGEMANYDFLLGLTTSTFDIEKVTAWKEGSVSYKNKRFGEILDILSDWYGVGFIVHKEINKNRTVSGGFNNQSLELVLEGLSFTMDFEFEINGREVILKQKPMK